MYSRVLRFLVAGGSAAAVEFFSFLGLNVILDNQSLIFSQSASFSCGFAVSFVLAKSWVFKSSGAWRRELSKYVILALLNLVLSNFLIMIISQWFGVHILPAKFLVMATIAAWNYFLASRLIFSSNASERRAKAAR